MSYSIELEEIPAEMAHKVNNVVKQFDDTTGIISKLEDLRDALREETPNIGLLLVSMDEIKNNLVSALDKISEYSFILAQYQKTVSELYLLKQQELELKRGQQLEMFPTEMQSDKNNVKEESGPVDDQTNRNL